VRAYFAPVNRTTQSPTLFDAAQMGSFNLDVPPSPWVDLGWCAKFARKCGTKIAALRTGAPSMPSSQVRTEADTIVQLEFESWGKLQMALACGSQQMNLLASTVAAVPLAAGSTATTLNVGAAVNSFSVGDSVAVDLDYTGQTGFVGAGVSGAYVKFAADVANDVNYIRRVTLNVGRVVAVANGALTLGAPLLAGAPATGMRAGKLAGFLDREGSSFFQEWSALFCIEGEQGDRVIFHYPRLQAMEGAEETVETVSAPLERMRLRGVFRALPVKDATDGETVLCFRSYLPAPMRSI
jgi:hypothetical protein